MTPKNSRFYYFFNRFIPNSISPYLFNIASLLFMLLLMLISISIGVADFSWADLFQWFLHKFDGQNSTNQTAIELMLISRLPRTLAIILTGASLSVAGMILQVVLKNRFIDPSMVGATNCAVLGLLIISLWLPASALIFKMGIATICAMVGMTIFMALIQRLPPTDYLLIPLIGIVFGGIVEAITLFIAMQTESLQMLSVWRFGDFSAILAGRYELLYLTGILAVLAYILADKLTIVGLGDAIAINLGVNRKSVLWFAITMVAMISSVVVITVGAIPFVGLVIPNIVSRLMGSRLKRCLPSVALLGASMVLLCDIVGRSVRYPYEIPVATVFGVFGSVIFLWLLLRKPSKNR